MNEKNEARLRWKQKSAYRQSAVGRSQRKKGGLAKRHQKRHAYDLARTLVNRVWRIANQLRGEHKGNNK